MTTIEIFKRGTKDVIGQITIPSNVYEIRLDQGIEFWVNDRDGAKNKLSYTKVMLKGIEIMSGADMTIFAQAAIGDRKGEINSGDIAPIYDHLSNMLSNHQPKFYRGDDCTIIYRGEPYKVPHIYTSPSNETLYQDLTVLESVELEEYARESKEQAQKEGDLSAEVWYRDYLTVLAFLLRKPDEELPMDDIERQNWLTARKKHFMANADDPGISLGVAMDVDFFLCSLENGLSNSPGPIGSLTNALLNQWVVTRKLKVKSRTTRRRVQNRRSTVPG